MRIGGTAGRRFCGAGLALLALAGCGGDGDELTVERSVEVGDVTETDVFAPADGTDLPVVVMLHGTEGDRSKMEPLARAVAERGAVVYLPSWPVLGTSVDDATAAEGFRAGAEAVVCSLRHARTTAAGYGGDPTELFLFGHSGGALVGAAPALVADPPWEGIDCEPGVDHRPAVFIATGGGFPGDAQGAARHPEEHAPYDPYTMEVTNSALRIRLVHGFEDGNVRSWASSDLRTRLLAEGLDVGLVNLDAGHGELIQPGTPEGAFVLSLIDDLLHGRSTAFDAEPVASLTYEGSTCTWDGPTGAPLGEPLTVELRNRVDVDVQFSVVGFDPEVSLQEVGALEVRPLEQVPEGVRYAGFHGVTAGTTDRLTWVLVDGDSTWVTYCLPASGSSHPAEGRMHPAVVLDDGAG
jgi:predicted esterase